MRLHPDPVVARRLRLWLLGFVSLLLGAAAAWVGWLAWSVGGALTSATDDAVTLQEAIAAGDTAASKDALDSLTAHSRTADARTSGATWAVLTRLPVVGDDARGVEVASDVLADVANHGVTPIIDSVTDLQALAPRDGVVPLDTIESLAGPVSDARAVFDRAEERLGAEDPSGYAGRLERRFLELRSQVAAASAALAAADVAVRLMPGMLGSDETRRYLLVNQNNAEVRGTGGLPGSVSLIEARNGRLVMKRQETGASFGEAAEPVLPLTGAEQALYGEQLGTYFLDANFTPDFPRVAELMRAHWANRFGVEVDGVFAVDPVALSYVLSATGPVDFGGNEPITSVNAVEALLNTVYLVFPAQVQQDEFFKSVAKSVFEAFTDGAQSSPDLLRAVATGVDERRILAHSFDPSEQELLAGTAIAGEVVTGPRAGPQVNVTLNDNTGSKMSYYLRTEVGVDATFCRDGIQGLSGDATLASVAPPVSDIQLPPQVTGGGAYGIEAGSQLVALRLFSPVGGTVDDIALDGEPIDDVRVIEQDDREVATTYVFLEPAQQVEVTWSMVSGPGQTGDIEVDVTPSIAAGSTSSVEPSSC